MSLIICLRVTGQRISSFLYSHGTNEFINRKKSGVCSDHILVFFVCVSVQCGYITVNFLDDLLTSQGCKTKFGSFNINSDYN